MPAQQIRLVDRELTEMCGRLDSIKLSAVEETMIGCFLALEAEKKSKELKKQAYLNCV